MGLTYAAGIKPAFLIIVVILVLLPSHANAFGAGSKFATFVKPRGGHFLWASHHVFAYLLLKKDFNESVRLTDLMLRHCIDFEN